MISQINDKFGGRIMKEFVKPKMYQDDIWQIMSILEKIKNHKDVHNKTGN